MSIGLTLVTGFILLEFGGDLVHASILAGLEAEKNIKPFLCGLLLIFFTILLFIGSFEAYREQYARSGVLTLVGSVGAIIFFLGPLIPQGGENVGLFAFLGLRTFPFFQLWMGVLAGILMLDCNYHFLEDVLRWLGIKKVKCSSNQYQ